MDGQTDRQADRKTSKDKPHNPHSISKSKLDGNYHQVKKTTTTITTKNDQTPPVKKRKRRKEKTDKRKKITVRETRSEYQGFISRECQESN